MANAPSITPWWWLSFVDDRRPKGQKSLGISIVQGSTLEDAVRVAHRLGCNPGGEVAGKVLPAHLLPFMEHRNRLHPPEDARDLANLIDMMATLGGMQ